MDDRLVYLGQLVCAVELMTTTEEPNHEFLVARFSLGRVFVASINKPVRDWAVYTGPGPDWWEVRTQGDKIGAEEAALIFPEAAAQYRYRR